MQGKLIVVEGLDGSGKTTQTPILVNHLLDKGIETKEISFPDYTQESSALVRMYLAGAFGEQPGDVNAYAASTFYAVDRYAAYKRYWGTDYHNGVWIISTRYTTSNAIHQMCKLPRACWDDYLAWMEDLEYEKMGIPRPDMVLFLDVPTQVSAQLLLQRYDGQADKMDIHEHSIDYLRQCREAAEYAAQKLGWQMIACTRDGAMLPVREIHQMIAGTVAQML